MNGKFFRPPQKKGGSSDESSDEEEEDEDFDRLKQKKSARANANLSEEEDDDEGDSEENEDELEDEDEDDDPYTRKYSKKRNREGGGTDHSKKRKKPTPALRKFIDEYAEASDDSEEDLDEYEDEYGEHHDPHDVVKKHYTQEDIRRENMDADAEELIRQQNRRRAQMPVFRADLDAAEIARQIEERHKMERRRVDFRNDDVSVGVGGADLAMSAVGQQSLLPSVSDPSLWMFGCANGKEEELVYQIMNKCISFARQGKPLGITAAVAAQSKGKIYIESFSEPAVLEAIQGIRNLLIYNKKLVPIQDMTTVLNVVRKKKPVKENEWVRMTRGHYKGDLALVRAVRDSGLKCIVQCVPRLDLMLADLTKEEARIRRRTVRPPQKFFNAQEIAAIGKHTISRQRYPGMGDLYCDFFESNYYNDGYLLKEVTVGTMIVPCSDEDPPSLDELQRFRNRNKGGDNGEGDENHGSKIAKSLLDELSELQGKTGLGLERNNGNSSGLVIGDTVEVIYGDLIGVRGKLLSIDGSTVKVKPTNAADLGDLTEIAFLIGQVKKYISIGAHVKVIDGRYVNETGIVVALELLDGDTDSTAVVLTDMTHKEISVRLSQLQESAEVASGQDNLAGYELHDLVVLSGGGATNEVGVIVRVGREEFTVINNHGIIREVRPEELRGKRNMPSNKAVALDLQGNQIRVGNTVSVAEGPHKGKIATIKRMHRAQLFLYSQTRTENAGIFVVRSRSCVLTGSKVSNRSSGGDGGGNVPFIAPNTNSRGNGSAPVRGRNDDGLIGKTVRIQAGQWKGYLGAVSDATPSHVQVELHSRMKKVMVARERVFVVGDKFGSNEVNEINSSYENNIAPMTPFHAGSTTPMHAGSTPHHAGATPMHDGYGGYTPSHASSTDDIWRPGNFLNRHGSTNVTSSNSEGYSSWENSSSIVNNSKSQLNSDSGGGWGAAWAGNSSDNSSLARDTWTPASSAPTNKDADQHNSTMFHNDTLVSIDDTTRRTVSDIDASALGSSNGEDAPVWFMERVCVLWKRNLSTAVIKEIIGDSAVIEFEDRSTMTVTARDVSMIAPKEHDAVLVIGGADVGFEGELVCIDGSDAILKDAHEDFKIVDFVHLAKIISDA